MDEIEELTKSIEATLWHIRQKLRSPPPNFMNVNTPPSPWSIPEGPSPPMLLDRACLS